MVYLCNPQRTKGKFIWGGQEKNNSSSSDH